MNDLNLFLPCAAGVEDYLLPEVQRITNAPANAVHKQRGGVSLRGTWRDALQLNLRSRLTQRVLVQLAHASYRGEQDLYDVAMGVAWEIWFTPQQTIKVEITAQHSPLKSLNFAALKIKDAVCDRFRDKKGARPDVDTTWPDVRIYAHLTHEMLTVYIDTSGEPLFKRGWREDKGEAPLKETLAAAMLAATGWAEAAGGDRARLQPLYDPCCGSGTIAIEAAQIACGMAPGLQRRFAFEKLLPFQAHVWQALKTQALAEVRKPAQPVVFGSDVAHRMVDFAQRNAQRAGVADVIEFRGGDALQRMPPSAQPGVMVLNPPYGERIGVGGSAREGAWRGDERAREVAETDDGGAEFFPKLATHWKKNFPGWTAWMLTPDLKLPGRMRLKESRRVPMWNGPIECRMFRFDMVSGRLDAAKTETPKTDA
jgi:putative N6-adenine-specific DNA methylase